MKFLIRQYYLFRRKRCIKIRMIDCPYTYGDVVYSLNVGKFKCLGKNWYYKIEN